MCRMRGSPDNNKVQDAGPPDKQPSLQPQELWGVQDAGQRTAASKVVRKGALRGAQDAGYPDINIIAEKVAAEGQTRFEDRYRLPIGISVNMTSYSGKLLTAALYNPRLIMVYAQARPACEFLDFSRHGLRAWHHVQLASGE